MRVRGLQGFPMLYWQVQGFPSPYAYAMAFPSTHPLYDLDSAALHYMILDKASHPSQPFIDRALSR